MSDEERIVLEGLRGDLPVVGIARQDAAWLIEQLDRALAANEAMRAELRRLARDAKPEYIARRIAEHDEAREAAERECAILRDRIALARQALSRIEFTRATQLQYIGQLLDGSTRSLFGPKEGADTPEAERRNADIRHWLERGAAL